MAAAAVNLGIYLRFLDRAAHGLPVAVSGLILIITLSNTSVLTAMLTHGLVAAVVILAVAPRNGWGRKPRREVLQRAEKQREAILASRTPNTLGRSRPPNPIASPSHSGNAQASGTRRAGSHVIH